MIKQLWNSVLAKYRDLSLSRRSINCLCLRHRQIINLLATDKSRYFARPRPIIDKYLIISVLGPYFVSFTIKNLHRQAIILQTNFEPPEQLPRIESGKVLTRNYERRRSDPLIFTAFDVIGLERLTINGKSEIRLIPTTQRKSPTVLSVPYIG